MSQTLWLAAPGLPRPYEQLAAGSTPLFWKEMALMIHAHGAHLIDFLVGKARDLVLARECVLRQPTPLNAFPRRTHFPALTLRPTSLAFRSCAVARWEQLSTLVAPFQPLAPLVLLATWNLCATSLADGQRLLDVLWAESKVRRP